MFNIIFAFFLLCFEITVYFSLDMYLVAIPNVMQHFSVSEDIVKLTFILWSLGAGSLQLILGPVTYLYGRKKTFILSIIFFVLATFLCVRTETFMLFCLGRFLQGTAVSSIFVAGYTTVHTIFTGKRVIFVTSFMNSVTLVAPALGPVFGAYILSYFGYWQSLFYFLLAFSGISFFGCLFFMPETATFRSLKISADFTYYMNVLNDQEFLVKSFLSVTCFCILFLWVIQSPFILLNHHTKSTFYYANSQIFVFGMYILSSLLVPFFCERICLKTHFVRVFMCIVLASLFLYILTLFQFSIFLQIISMGLISFMIGSVNALSQRLVLESSPSLPLSHKMAMFSTFISVFSILVGLVSVAFNDLDLSLLSLTYILFSLICLTMLKKTSHTYILRQENIDS